MYGIISWGSEWQKSVALCKTECEYVAASLAVKELVWLKNLLCGLLQAKLDESVFYMGKQIAIWLVKNPDFHNRTEHIDVRYHLVCEKFKDGILKFQYVQTNNQIADIMSKALSKPKHQHFFSLMNVVPKS